MDVPPIDRQVRRNVGGAAEETEFGSIQWVVRAGEPEGVEQTVGLVVIDAGKGNVEHVHPNCDEILLVLEGEAEHTLGRQSTRLRANDLIVVPRGVPHGSSTSGPPRRGRTWSSRHLIGSSFPRKEARASVQIDNRGESG